MGFKYKIVEENNELKLAKIQKSGIKHEFTLQEVYDHIGVLEKHKKEIEAMCEFKGKITTAFSKAGNFDFLASKFFTAKEVRDLARYFADLDEVMQSKKKLSEIEQQLEEYKVEVAEILKQIDGKNDKKDSK